MTIESIDLNLLEDKDQTQSTIINESISSFDSILRATTVDLLDITVQKLRHTEASLKFKADMDTCRVMSAAVAIIKVIDKAVSQVNSDITTNRITQLWILNLKKQLLQHR